MYKCYIPIKPVIQPIDPMLLTEEENRTRTVESVNFIKEKRDGCIKDRTCVNGSIQHRYLKYGEIVSLPTVPLEALFLTLVVDKY